jgi:hypothetical protein
MGKTAVGTKKGAEKFLKGYKGKGRALATAGQIDVDALTGAPTNSIVFGVADVKGVMMRKQVAGKWEYEQVDPDNVEAMKTEGYEIVASAKATIRTLSSTIATPSASTSKILHVKLTTSVSYEWAQPLAIYTQVGAASRTRLAQVDGSVPNADERVRRAAGFIFNAEYAGIPAGTYIPLNGIKAKFRYAAATPATATNAGNSGIYTSFAGDTAWTA